MTQGIQLTSTDAASHNLYALILAALSVTQLPQRVDQGAAIFPDFVAQVTFSLPISQAGNSGASLSVMNRSGSEMLSLIPGFTQSLGAGLLNNVSLQALYIQASASGVVTDVSIVQN